MNQNFSADLREGLDQECRKAEQIGALLRLMRDSFDETDLVYSPAATLLVELMDAHQQNLEELYGKLEENK